MFAVLNIKESHKKRIKKNRTVTAAYKYNTGNHDCFYVIDVLSSEQGLNTHEIAGFLGKRKTAVLLDRKFDLKETSEIIRFEPTEFKNMILLNTMSIIFRELYLSGIRIKCCLIDKQAKCANNIENIVRYAAHTSVVTENRSRYFSTVKHLYDYYGASVTISEKPVSADNTVIIDVTGDFKQTEKGILFSSGKNGYYPLEAEGYGNLKAMRPRYIDEMDFLGAVFEFNHVESLKTATLKFFAENKTPVSLLSVMRMLKTFFEKNNINEKNAVFYV